VKIETTGLRDLFILTPDTHQDSRGFFMESYRQDLLTKAGITDVFVQDNHSRSVRNVVRGFHFQYDAPMSKIMRVTRGSAYLVAVDIRTGSPTLGKWFGIECSEDNKSQVYAPAGFARGFQTLTDDCEVQYKCSALYNPNAQGEIRWDDPELGIDWPIKDAPLVSSNDSRAGTLKDWLTRPEAAIFRF
jgi:dTDP-4-dehydrorhamnose 3,5-epimerase